jgi:hypothetical protein
LNFAGNKNQQNDKKYNHIEMKQQRRLVDEDEEDMEDDEINEDLYLEDQAALFSAQHKNSQLDDLIDNDGDVIDEDEDDEEFRLALE